MDLSISQEADLVAELPSHPGGRIPFVMTITPPERGIGSASGY
jgi:hypothetical protein